MANTLPGVPILPSTPRPLLVTQPEAARLLSLSERTVYTLRTSGRLPTVRVGGKVLLRYSDLAAFAAGHGTELTSEQNGGGE